MLFKKVKFQIKINDILKDFKLLLKFKYFYKSTKILI